jgi:hypothetical protein
VAVRVTKKDDKPAAETAWQNKEMKSYFSSGVAAGELLLLVTNTIQPVPAASISCLEAKSGKELWSKEVGYFHAAVIHTANGKLLVLNDSGLLTLWDFDASGAKQLASVKRSAAERWSRPPLLGAVSTPETATNWCA